MAKMYWVICAFTFLSFGLHGQNNLILNESFNAGIPSNWTVSSASASSYGGKTCVVLSSSGSITTIQISKAGSLTFSHRASGNGKTLSVEKSVNNGSWEFVGSASPSSSSSWGSTTFSINEGGQTRLRLSANSGSIYITDIQLTSVPSPIFLINTSEINLGTVFVGESSDAQPLTINGNYFSQDIILSIQGEGFGVKQTGSEYIQNTTISKDNLPLNVFLNYQSPDVAVGSVSGVLTISSEGATPISINLKAYSSEPVPSILISPTQLKFGYQLYGSTSASKAINISGKYLNTESGILSIIAPDHFQVSIDDKNFVDSTALSFSNSTLESTQIFIRFSPKGTEHKADLSGSILVAGGGTSTLLKAIGSGVTSFDDIASQYYISPTGNDQLGDGSITKPWYTLDKAITSVEPGDTIHCRGGTYEYSTTVRLEKSGMAKKRIAIFAYQDDLGNFEKPIFDFKNQPYGASNRGMMITGNYWYLYGLHITHAGDNGIKLEGNHCIIERCTFSYNGDTGIQLGFGHNFSDSHPGISSNDGSYCAYNVIVDCDSYQNYDQDNYGSDADGFACKMHNGKENWFIRCRAWNNSDDAWDLYETDYPVYIIECWGWHSGDASQHPVSGGSFQGNGNGIKMGGNGSGGSSKGKHEVWNSVAFNNNKTGSVKGFDQNSHKGGVKVVNCLGFNNGYDFMFEDAPGGVTNEFYNNICLSNRIEINSANAIMQNNTAINNPDGGWLNALTVNFSSGDFNDLSESTAKSPRNDKGAMPATFARLVAGSQLIDKGMNGLTAPMPDFLDQPLVGDALQSVQKTYGPQRDLGPYEYSNGNTVPIECKSSGDAGYSDLDKDGIGDDCDDFVVVYESVKALPFPLTTIGNEVQKTLYIKNTGRDDGLQITNISVPSGFSIDKSTGNIDAGDSLLVMITFSPTQHKMYEGAMIISSIVGQFNIALSGQGTTEEIIASSYSHKLHIYPNPAKDMVWIDLGDYNPEPVKIEILGLDGKVHLYSSFTSGKNTLNIKDLESGVYMLRLISNGLITTRKIIKK